MTLASTQNSPRPRRFGLLHPRRGPGVAAGLLAAMMLAGCVSNNAGNMTVDFGEVLAKEQQIFTVNGERAALRRYVNGSYDIKLYGQQKVMELEVSGSQVLVANAVDVGNSALIALDVPEAGCNHVYYIYQVTGAQSKKWQNSYRSCEGPLAFNVINGQWTARQTVKPATGTPYMLVYQDGNLYTRPLASAEPASNKKAYKKPVKRRAVAAKPAQRPAADNAANLDDVQAPSGTDLDNIATPAAAANLDDIAAPTGKVSTAGLKADTANAVRMKDE